MQQIIDSIFSLNGLAATIISVITAIITTWLTDALYKNLNHGKIEFQIQHLQNKPQLFYSEIKNPIDLQAKNKLFQSCNTFYQCTLSYNEKNELYLDCKRINVNQISMQGVFAFIYIQNKTGKQIWIKEISTNKKVPISLNALNDQFLAAEESIALIINKYNCPNSLSIDSDGILLEYEFGEREGYITPKVKIL